MLAGWYRGNTRNVEFNIDRAYCCCLNGCQEGPRLGSAVGAMDIPEWQAVYMKRIQTVISSMWLLPKHMVTGEVWWETSQRRDPSREVALSGLDNGKDFNPSNLAKLESMKLVSALESTSTVCGTGDPETRKDTDEQNNCCSELTSIFVSSPP